MYSTSLGVKSVVGYIRNNTLSQQNVRKRKKSLNYSLSHLKNTAFEEKDKNRQKIEDCTLKN